MSIALLAARSALNHRPKPFSPAALFKAGQQGTWFDPSDLSTLFQDAAGTTPVTAAGQPVGMMKDKSGNGNHATQPSSSARPLYQIDANSHPCLVFDGVDDYLATANVDPRTSSKLQSVFGFSTNTNGVAVPYALNAFSPDSAVFLAINANTTIYTNGATAVEFDYTGNIPVSTPVVFSVLHDIASPTFSGAITLNKNTVLETPTSRTFGVPNGTVLSNVPIYIGTDGGGDFGPCNLYQIVLSYAVIDANTLLLTENFVNSRTGAY